MKKIRNILGIFVLASVMALCACGGADKTSTENIQLNHSSLEMEIGQRTVLELTDGQKSITERVMWLSSDASVATVDGGLVKAERAGSCVITAVYEKTDYVCTVKVKAEPVCSLDKTSLQIRAGKTARLQFLQDGVVVTDGVKWSSSAPTVVSVKDGLVSAKKEGKATITASYYNEKYNCEVTVLAAESVTITNKTQNVTFDAPASAKQDGMKVLFAKNGGSFPLECETLGNSSLHFTSSDESVAKIDSKSGEVTPVKAGVAILTVESEKLGPNGELYSDSVVLVVKDSGSARTENCYQAETSVGAIRLNLRDDGTFEYYAVKNSGQKNYEIFSYCSGVYTENEQGIVLYWIEEETVHGSAVSAEGGGFATEELFVEETQTHSEFVACKPQGKYHCEIHVSEMEETFRFDMTLNADGSYVYFRYESESKEEGVVNQGTWKVANGGLVFAYDGGEMLFDIVSNGCIKSVDAIPTGGMDATLTFFIV